MKRRKEFFFDYTTLTLHNQRLFNPKKKEGFYKFIAKLPFVIAEGYKARELSKAYATVNNSQRLDRFFLRQYFRENKRIFRLIGHVNRKNLKRFFMSIHNKDSILHKIERRLDLTLLSSHMVPTINYAKQVITYGHVFVNKKPIMSEDFILRKGDFVTLSPYLFFYTKIPFIRNFFVKVRLKSLCAESYKDSLSKSFMFISSRFNSRFISSILSNLHVPLFLKVQICFLFFFF